MREAANRASFRVFYVYLYKRPDGSVFYVGKGTKRRAQCMAPSRRTLHFMNIVRKYGAENVQLELIACESEQAAFDLEIKTIRELRESGARLVNLTDGGEGCANRPLPEKSVQAFKEWQGAYHRLSDGAKQRILDGLAEGRKKTAEWKKTPEGQAHMKRLADIGRQVLHRERSVCCEECQVDFVTKSAKTRFCSRLCEQRNRRRRQAA